MIIGHEEMQDFLDNTKRRIENLEALNSNQETMLEEAEKCMGTQSQIIKKQDELICSLKAKIKLAEKDSGERWVYVGNPDCKGCFNPRCGFIKVEKPDDIFKSMKVKGSKTWLEGGVLCARLDYEDDYVAETVCQPDVVGWDDEPISGVWNPMPRTITGDVTLNGSTYYIAMLDGSEVFQSKNKKKRNIFMKGLELGLKTPKDAGWTNPGYGPITFGIMEES